MISETQKPATMPLFHRIPLYSRSNSGLRDEKPVSNSLNYGTVNAKVRDKIWHPIIYMTSTYETLPADLHTNLNTTQKFKLRLLFNLNKQYLPAQHSPYTKRV
jgi:hypothetical protein